MPAAILQRTSLQAARLPLQRRGAAGFTLAELLVTVGVLVVLVLLFTQLLNSAATITTLGHKQMDADSQARQLLDRMAIDFAQLVKRSDVDFFAKGTTAPNSVGGAMAGNDQIAFYSACSGLLSTDWFAKPGLACCLSSKFATRASSSYNKMERWERAWCGTVSLRLTTGCFYATYNSLSNMAFRDLAVCDAAVRADPDAAYEIIGPQVFRFEYCYLLTER